MASNYWLKSGTYAMMQRATTFVLGFGSYLLLIRYFDVDDFGVWTLYVVVSGAIEMSRSAFIQNAFLKFYNETGAHKGRFFAGSLLLNALSTVVFIVVLVALLPILQKFWSSEAIGVLLLWYCLTSILLIPLTQINYLEQANHSFRGVFWSTFARQGTFFLIVVIYSLFIPGKSLAFFASMHSLSAFVGLITAYIISRQIIPTGMAFDRVVIGKLFKFGRFILGTGITSTVGKNADQVILGAVSHPMVAIYNSAVRVLNFIEIPTLALSSVVYPKLAVKANEDKHAVGHLYEKSVSTILGIIFPVVVLGVLFPKFVLTIIAGERYLAAAPSLRVMVVTALLLPFNVQTGSACEVIGKPHVSFYINLVANILNVILNVVLIKLFGLMGASMAFAITMLLIFVTGQTYLSSKLDVSIFRIIKGIPVFYKDGLELALGFVRKKKFNT